MKRIRFVIVLVLLSGFLWSDTLDRIVAKVGRGVILKSELDERYQQITAMGESDITLEDLLEEMIEAELILLTARESDIEIDEYMIKKMADQEIESLSKQFASELEFREALRKETKLSVSELRDYYIRLITEQKLRESVISQEISKQVHVTDAEVKNYYDDNIAELPVKPASDKIGMILLKLEPGKSTRADIKKQLFDIKDLLNKGADFSELAQKYSECPSAKKGGSLGYVEKGIMVKPFEDVAFNLAEGDVSDIVETQFGYHLIMLEEKKEDQIKLRHILKLLNPSEEDIIKAKELSEEIRDRIIAGEEFGKLAAAYSQDDSSAVNGGIIGEYTPAEYPELFKEYLDDLDYGEISEVIKEGDNLYIFGKLEKMPARPYTYKELYSQLKNKVHQKKQIDIYDEWIEKIKQKTYIEIFL